MNAQSWKLAAGCVGLIVALSGCGGGGGGGGDSPSGAASGGTTTGGGSSSPTPTVPAATGLSIGIGLKQLQLSWTAVAGASSYRILEATDGSTFVQLGGDLPGTQTTYNRDIAVHQQNWSGARYQVQACNTEGCSTSAAIGAASGVLQAIGYFKASNTNAGDNFGWTLALSTDGNTLAVGAPGEASAAKDIGGSQTDNSVDQAGAVYVFARGSSGWTQQAYLKSANTQVGDTFGESLALSANGNTLVAGAPLDNSASLNDSGAAYVFVRTGSTWATQATLRAPTPAGNAYFGWASALSSDGNTLAIGAVGTATDTGAVHVFTRSGASWTARTALTASNAGSGDNFGSALALNGAGTVLAVGAPYEASANTTQSNNSAASAGAVYTFAGSGASWSQTGYLKASNVGAGDNFGASVSLSSTGDVLAVGAPYEASSATGVDGSQSNNSATLSGAVYVFNATGGTWTQSAYLKASNTGANDNFGTAVALGSAGNWLAVGAIGESSAATGLGGNQADNTRDGVGAAYTFALSGGTWAQQSYIKPATAQAGGEFGSTFGVSADTRTLAIGATFEGSAAQGVGGSQTSTSAAESGAVWLY
jgi:hypothetical protein